MASQSDPHTPVKRLSSVRSTQHDSSIDHDPEHFSIDSDITSNTSASDDIGTSYNSPAPASESQRHLHSLLDDFAPDHLCGRPGKKRRLNEEYSIQMLRAPYDASRSRSMYYGYHVPDFRDPNKHEPWTPVGLSASSSLVTAHRDHRERYERVCARDQTTESRDDRHQESSWVKRTFCDRLPPSYAAHMRECSDRCAGPAASAVAEHDEFVNHGSNEIEPLRKIVAHPRSGIKPAGNSRPLREKVFDFAQKLRSQCRDEPLPLHRSTSSTFILPSERPILAGEEYDVVDGDSGELDALESIFDGPDAPIGAFDSAERDYYLGLESMKLAEQLKQCGETAESIEKSLLSILGRGKNDFHERFEKARSDLIATGKLLPKKVPTSSPKSCKLSITIKKRKVDDITGESPSVGGEPGTPSPGRAQSGDSAGSDG